MIIRSATVRRHRQKDQELQKLLQELENDDSSSESTEDMDSSSLLDEYADGGDAAADMANPLQQPQTSFPQMSGVLNRSLSPDRRPEEAPSSSVRALSPPAWFGNAKVSANKYAKIMGNAFSQIGISQQSMGKVLKAVKAAVPVPNQLPSSFRQLLKLVSPDLLKLSKAFICPHGCPGSSSDTGSCNSCNTEREPFYFLDVCEWLQKLYGHPVVSKLLQCHGSAGLANEDQHISDVWQTELWSQLFSEVGCFFGDKRSIVLSVAIDGTSLLRTKKHSCWPLVLNILNLPPALRFKPLFTLVWGILPAKRKPERLDGVFEILVDQLTRLNRGVYTLDSSRAVDDQGFNLTGRLMLLKVICSMLIKPFDFC